MASAITGTPFLSASPTAYTGANTSLSAAIQTIWSKEILFQAMPILRFEQFAVKKTELGVQPGLTINFMRYNNLGSANQLVEGVRMQTNALSASQFSITVAEQGYAVAVSELLLNASFDDVMASASRLLGRNMAIYLDVSARNTLNAGIFCYLRLLQGPNRCPYDALTL
jgi:N4-gp56 family major capsid protein